MRFGVLGPLAVWASDGTPVRVPEMKVRALLADLLAHAGTLVSADRLVEDIWGNEPPGNPTNTLQTKVSQLRRLLDQAIPNGRALVVRQPPGYLLSVDVDDVDAHRFEALVKRAAATNDLGRRSVLLSEALGLWRGQAFAEFADAAFVRETAVRLDEQRLIALEDLSEARLGLGEHRIIVGDLRDLVARYPLRERLRSLLMRVLYQSGRQSDALACYEDLRITLRDELGVDPSPEVRALHRAILTHDPSLNSGPPPSTSAVRSRTNLPPPRTALVGRSHAATAVSRRLREARLVTLVGPGGVGKTRLALHVANQLLVAEQSEVFLVEFAAVGRDDTAASPDSAVDIADLVAAALGTRIQGAPPPSPAADMTARLCEALRERDLLLLFDSCEHVIDQVAALADQLLDASPGVRILATSREPLRVTGEAVVQVAPLELPSRPAPVDIAALRSHGAVELFEARAAAAAPGFTLSLANAEPVVEICRRLDGIPLAIELAAARVHSLGVHEIARRLDDRFALLTSGSRNAPVRHQTLRATIDWSWQLLDQRAQGVLRRLSVFPDSFDLAAAAVVAASGATTSAEVPDVVAGLVDRSLVATIDGCDESFGLRYRLLGSVAAYCRERLVEAGEHEQVHAAHRRYYIQVVESAEPHLRGRDQRRWLARLDAEAPNLRAAITGADADDSLRLADAAAWYWLLRGRLPEAHQLLTVALSARGVSSPARRARTIGWRTGVEILLGGCEDPCALATAALASYAGVDDRAGRAMTALFLGSALFGVDRPSIGESLTQEALKDFRALSHEWGVAAALAARAWHHLLRGNLGAVRRDAEDSASQFEQLGDRWGRIQAIQALEALAEITGDYERAAALDREILHLAEDLRLWPEAAHALCRLGRIELLNGDVHAARDLHHRGRQLAAEQSHHQIVQTAEFGLALCHRRAGELDEAEAILRRWLDRNRRLGSMPGIALIAAHLGFVAEARGDAPGALELHREAHAAACATRDPRAIALALEGLAGAHALAGDHLHAAELLGAAEAARNSVQAPLPPAERHDVDRITATLRDALGNTTLLDQLERGRQLDPELRQPPTTAADADSHATHAAAGHTRNGRQGTGGPTPWR